LLAVVLVGAAAVACGTTAVALDHDTGIESEPDLPLIRFGDNQFQSLWVNNAIAAFILEEGYGYPTETVALTTQIMQVSLPRGDIDVHMEGWEHRFFGWFDEESGAGRIFSAGPVYEGGPQFWVIPEWVHEEHGIDTVADLADNWELFKDPEDPNKGVFVNCIIGWQCEQINLVKLQGYGLDAHFNSVSPGSAAALDAALVGAQKRRQPVFGYHWAPTAVSAGYDWHVLGEPAYSRECWARIIAAKDDPSLRPIEGACAYETVSINTLVNSGLRDKAPDAVSVLENMFVGIDALTDVVGWFSANELSEYRDAAVYFLRNYAERWTEWVTEEAASNIRQSLATN
jgi:glycine betaine/proline transport system substrate-binding protein